MRLSSLWNVFTLSLVALTGLVALASAWLFVDPHSRLNPFPPSPSPLVSSLPASGVTPAPGPTRAALLYPTFPPEWTETLTPLPTFTFTPRPTRTPTLTPTATPTIPPTPTLPAEARITDIVGHRQALSLSCEARSAADWAAHFGLAIDELEFLGRLPASDNPEAGFVGDVHGDWGFLPPEGYGVYAGPVAELLRAYGVQARAYRGLTWEDLKKEIAEGRPVIVWVVGHVGEEEPVTYTAQDGQTVTVARYEHTVILIGYSATRVIVLDGGTTYGRSHEIFLRSWSVLGNMAILWKP
jgi:uncharacterized protein YvpB